MQINSSQIQCFLATARTKNFTRAAQELYISQPVLSRKIASMEEELGVTLFDRSGKVVQLTAAGVFSELCGRTGFTSDRACTGT